jgi:hypothetical protein
MFCAKSRVRGPRVEFHERAPPHETSRPTNEKGRPGEMLNYWSYATLQDRMARERELAERRRLALAAAPHRPPLRARMARRLFALAVALDRRETWSAVWERLEAKGRL